MGQRRTAHVYCAAFNSLFLLFPPLLVYENTFMGFTTSWSSIIRKVSFKFDRFAFLKNHSF